MSGPQAPTRQQEIDQAFYGLKRAIRDAGQAEAIALSCADRLFALGVSVHDVEAACNEAIADAASPLGVSPETNGEQK